jgi:PBSX family phage portal protein
MAAAKGRELGKVTKVLLFDAEGNKVGETRAPSTQIPADPFTSMYSHGLVKPPFDLERLVFLAESHPTHGSAIEQKASDVIGVGWEWEKISDDAPEPLLPGAAAPGAPGEPAAPDDAEAQREELEDWFDGLAGDDLTMAELLYQVELDFETTANGYIEVARLSTGVVDALYHMPAHTARWHASGKKLAQERGGKFVWFQKWGATGDDGEPLDGFTDRTRGYNTTDAEKAANELLVFRKTSRRSSWYGVPTWISAVGWITLAISARDYNIMFFENSREARWAIILENIDDDPDILENLEQAIRLSLREPHRNIIIPIIGDGKVTFQKLSQDGTDLSFEKLDQKCDDKILVAHRMPGDRVGLSKTGPLGGSAAGVTNTVYVEGCVTPAQEILASRINRFIEVEFALHKGVDPKDLGLRWRWTPKAVDLSEEAADLNAAVTGFARGVLTLNEARVKMGAEALPDGDERGKKYFWELVPQGAPGGGSVGAAVMDEARPLLEDQVEQRLRLHEEKLIQTLDLLG